MIWGSGARGRRRNGTISEQQDVGYDDLVRASMEYVVWLVY